MLTEEKLAKDLSEVQAKARAIAVGTLEMAYASVKREIKDNG